MTNRGPHSHAEAVQGKDFTVTPVPRISAGPRRGENGQYVGKHKAGSALINPDWIKAGE